MKQIYKAISLSILLMIPLVGVTQPRESSISASNNTYTYCTKADTVGFVLSDRDVAFKDVKISWNSEYINKSTLRSIDSILISVLNTNEIPDFKYNIVFTVCKPFPYGKVIETLVLNESPQLKYIMRQDIFICSDDSTVLYVNYLNPNKKLVLYSSSPFVIYRTSSHNFWDLFAFNLRCSPIYSEPIKFISPQQRVLNACTEKKIYPSKDACELIIALNPPLRDTIAVPANYKVIYPVIPKISKSHKKAAKKKYKLNCKPDVLVGNELKNEIESTWRRFYSFKESNQLKKMNNYNMLINEIDNAIKNTELIKPVIDKTAQIVIKELKQELKDLSSLLSRSMEVDDPAAYDKIFKTLSEINSYTQSIAHTFKLKLSDETAMLIFPQNELLLANNISGTFYLPKPINTSNYKKNNDFSWWNWIWGKNGYESKALVARTCSLLVWKCLPSSDNCNDSKRPLDQNILKDQSLVGNYYIYLASPAFIYQKMNATPADSSANTSTANLTKGLKLLWATDLKGKGVSDTTELRGEQVSSKYFYIRVK